MKSTKDILLNLFDSYIFWDIDVEKINIQKEYELIISRVLMFTDSNHFLKNIESLKELFSFNLIRNTVLNTKERISDEIISLFSKTYALNIKSKFNSNVCFA